MALGAGKVALSGVEISLQTRPRLSSSFREGLRGGGSVQTHSLTNFPPEAISELLAQPSMSLSD